jgi:hypothetical protein
VAGLRYDSAAPRPQAIGIAVSIDRAWASIGAAGGDRPHLGSVTRRPGTGWVVAEADRIQREHGCEVVVDGRGPAADLIGDLELAGVRHTVTTTAQYLDACAKVYDSVQEKNVEHGDYDDLNAAVGCAQKRYVGERWAWARKTGDVSMLEAVTLALWGLEADYDLLNSFH